MGNKNALPLHSYEGKAITEKTQDYINLGEQYGAHNYHPLDVVITKGEEVRGKGLMTGVKLNLKAGRARRFAESLQYQGILVKETQADLLRFAPPLVIDQETIDWSLPRIRNVLNMK